MEKTNLENLINFDPPSKDLSPYYPSDASDISDNENPISISECLRLHEGNVKVHGTIASISRLYKMIRSVTLECKSCEFIQSSEYPIPIDVPQNINKKCINCGGNYQEIEVKFNYINAVKTEIQDSDTFSEIEKLSCILFDKNTIDIQIGSKVKASGSIQIINRKNRKSLPHLYASAIEYENKEKLELSDKDIDTIHRFKKLKNGALIGPLTKMFATSIFGLDIIKTGLLLSAVSSSEDLPLDGNRDRLHVLLVGHPGTGKSKLIKESVNLVTNSRYESSQHASGKSLTAIVSKENDEDYCLRTGPIPMSLGAICVLNEIGRTTPEDQGFLLDVMEEGEFTINKYGINAKIKSPTVIIASANPINSTNNDIGDKLDIHQIPIINAVIDRFDLVFVVKDPADETEVRAYADKKTRSSIEVIPDYYPYLKKHIAYAKQFKPTLTEESRVLINEYYVNLVKSSKYNMKFKSKRTLDTLVRISKSFAKLKLKNKMEIEDAREALEFFNAVIYQYADSTVLIPGDPKNISISVFTEILKNSRHAYSLEELSKTTCEKNEYVKSYLLEGNKSNNHNRLFKIENNRKLRNIYDHLIENPHIARIREKPIVLQWIDSRSPSDISDASDISDISKNKINDDKNNNADVETMMMSDASDMSDTITTKSSESENDKAVDKSTPSNNDYTITEILKSEPMIGYTKPFYHCKEHPRVQYIDHKEIKNHIKYSREHQQST